MAACAGALLRRPASDRHDSMQVVPLDCWIHTTGLPLHVSRTIVQIIVPIIIMILLMLACYINHLYRGNAADPGWLRRHISITAFSVTGFYYPSLSQAALNIFSCFPIDQPIPAGTVYQHFLQVSVDAPHSFTCLLNHMSPGLLVCLLTRRLTCPPTHPNTHPPAHPNTHPPTYPPTHLLTHVLAHTLGSLCL